MVARSSLSRIAGGGLLPGLAASLKESLSLFGPPRNGVEVGFAIGDEGEEGTGQGLHGEGIGAGQLDEFTELDGLLVLDLLLLLHECLEFSIEVTGFAGHGCLFRLTSVKPNNS